MTFNCLKTLTPLLQYKSEFGVELSEGTPARYEYWPSKQKTFPLLYYCATQLLAGDTNATCFSERMHSPAGRIASKFRASMKPDKIERLTLALFLIRMQIEEDEARGKLDAAVLDAEELLAEQALAEADAGDSDSDSEEMPVAVEAVDDVLSA